MTDWQPIETAPTDGTEFQAWLRLHSKSGIWEPKCRFDKHGNFQVWQRTDYDQEGWDMHIGDTVPTHWMPLPEPPND